MDISPVNPGPKAADIPLQMLAGNQSVSEREKVAEVCRQFEAVLLRQILAESRKKVISSPGAAQDSTANGIYDDMVNNQLADGISRSGSFGLAKSLQGQLAHQVLPRTPGTAPRPAAPNSAPITASHH